MVRNAVLAALAALAGCAEAPETIAPAYVGAAGYMSLTCSQIGEEQVRLTSALTTASTQQSSARTYDTVGVLLIGLPLSSMSGGNVSAQIAQYKGEQIALERAARMKSCYTRQG